MNKFFFLFLPFILNAAFINLPFIFSTKKDQIANFKIYYDNNILNLKLRWTLYKNGVLVLLYNYNKFPYQITLYNEFGLDCFKINIASYPGFNPVLYIKVNKFSSNLIEFEMYLNKQYNEKIKIDYKGKK